MTQSSVLLRNTVKFAPISLLNAQLVIFYCKHNIYYTLYWTFKMFLRYKWLKIITSEIRLGYWIKICLRYYLTKNINKFFEQCKKDDNNYGTVIVSIMWHLVHFHTFSPLLRIIIMEEINYACLCMFKALSSAGAW